MIILCDSPKREYDSAQTVVSFSKFHYSVTSRHDTTRLVAACVRRDEPSPHVTSDNMRLVHWPLMDGLLHLVQRRRDWAEPQFAQPNVTARPSAASLPITVLSYDDPRVKIKRVLQGGSWRAITSLENFFRSTPRTPLESRFQTQLTPLENIQKRSK